MESLRALQRSGAERLHRAGIDGAALDARVLLLHVLGKPASHLIAHGDETLPPEHRERFEALLRRRLAHEPLAYILGEREFWSLPFTVTADTLIPRPDSETVVEAVIEAFPDKAKPLTILDFGTGSGCLLLALLSEYPQARGIGVEIDAAALDVASGNARKLGLDARASWRQGTWGNGMQGIFDSIVANPPYIPQRDAATLSPDVRDHEPHTALFAGEDGLDAYRTLAPDIARLLAPSGRAVLEIGAGQEVAVTEIMTAAGLELFARRRDLGGHTRALTFGGGTAKNHENHGVFRP